MRTAHVNFLGMHLDYGIAHWLASHLAKKDKEIMMPVMVAWSDQNAAKASPVLEGCGVAGSWHDYGESHGGQLEVNVNGEYEFIFGDAAGYESYGPSPYINLHDLHGKEYICLVNSLRHAHQPDHPSRDACVALDEWTSKLT